MDMTEIKGFDQQTEVVKVSEWMRRGQAMTVEKRDCFISPYPTYEGGKYGACALGAAAYAKTGRAPTPYLCDIADTLGIPLDFAISLSIAHNSGSMNTTQIIAALEFQGL